MFAVIFLLYLEMYFILLFSCPEILYLYIEIPKTNNYLSSFVILYASCSSLYFMFGFYVVQHLQVFLSFYLRLLAQSLQFLKKNQKKKQWRMFSTIHSDFQMLQKFQFMTTTEIAAWTKA